MKRSTIVALVAALFLAGCGGGDAVGPASVGGGQGVPGSVPGQATLHGLAALDDQPLEGATVAVLAPDDSTLPLAEAATTDRGGAFTARLSHRLPTGAFRVVVTTPNGESFTTEREGIAHGETAFVHVNALTTLCRAYHRRHPEMSLALVRARVHGYVGIRAHFDLGDQVGSPYYSMFSSRTFVETARQHPAGFAAYLDAVAGRIDGAAAKGLVAAEEENNWIVPYVEPQNFLAEIVPEWENGVGRVVAPATTVAEDVASEFSLADGIGDGLIDNVIAIIVDHIPGLGHASDLEEIQDQISQVQDDLSQISQMLDGLAITLNQQFTQTEYTALSTSVQAQAQHITSAYAQIQQIQQDAYGVPPSHTPNTSALATDIQSLYANANWVNTGILADATTLHQVQSLGTPGNAPLLTYARQLTNTTDFLSSTTMSALQAQMNYYQGLQVQALNVLAALNAPATWNVVGQDTPAGLRLQAARWIAQISGNIAQEVMQQPFPPYTSNHFADIRNGMLYQDASVSKSGGGATITYASTLTDGGMGWQVAGNPSLQATFNLVNTITGQTNQSITGWMNTNLGTNLQPGPVTYYSSRTANELLTAVSKGFLTISAVPDSKAGQFDFTIGWIDDHGKTGKIGIFTGTWADLATNLDSGYWAIDEDSKNGGYAASIKGPCILMRASDTTSTNAFGSFVVLGQYSGLTVTRPTGSAFVADPYSQGSSGTMSLQASTTAPAFDLSQDVYWTSSDPTNAPISNVPVAPGPASTATFPPLPMSPGTIHWLPGSYGASVTFTAQRQRPQDPAGTLVQASLTLTSPVTNAAPRPQAISVWPSRYGVVASNWADFAANGLQLQATRYYGSGDCQDARSAVTYSLGPNSQGFTISPQGWLSTTLPAKPAAGTQLIVTVTDPQVPAATAEGNVRQADTLTVTFD